MTAHLKITNKIKYGLRRGLENLHAKQQGFDQGDLPFYTTNEHTAFKLLLVEPASELVSPRWESARRSSRLAMPKNQPIRKANPWQLVERVNTTEPEQKVRVWKKDAEVVDELSNCNQENGSVWPSLCKNRGKKRNQVRRANINM